MRIMEEYNPGAFIGTKGMTQKQYFLYGENKDIFYLSILRTWTWW